MGVGGTWFGLIVTLEGELFVVVDMCLCVVSVVSSVVLCRVEMGRFETGRESAMGLFGKQFVFTWASDDLCPLE